MGAKGSRDFPFSLRCSFKVVLLYAWSKGTLNSIFASDSHKITSTVKILMFF